MELTTTSTLALFETTKEQRKTFVNSIIEQVINGEVDVLKVHMQAKCTEQLMKELTDNPHYKTELLDAAQKHGKKFETYNSEFRVKEAGVKWDYSNCNDSYYDALVSDMKTMQEKIKVREKFLQTLPPSGVASPDTGEMLYPAIKTSTTIVQCTLK